MSDFLSTLKVSKQSEKNHAFYSFQNFEFEKYVLLDYFINDTSDLIIIIIM